MKMNRVLHSLFSKVIDVSLYAYQFYIPEGTLTYHENVKKMFQQNILENCYKVENLGMSGESNIGEYHAKMADCQRADIKHKSRFNVESVKLENSCLFSSPDIPILFIDHYKVEPDSPTGGERGNSFSDIIDQVEKVIDEKPRRKTSIEKLSKESGEKNDYTRESTARRQSDIQVNTIGENVQPSVVGPTEFENLYTSVDEFEEFENGKHIVIPSSVHISPLMMSKNDICEVNTHLVFLVHGYQGSSFDLSFLKDCLMFLAEDNLKIICSTVNDNDSSRCIDELGLNLATEVKDAVNAMGSAKSLKR